MNKETTWVKQASANVNREDTNDDIIVTTVEGYIYQIYYDEVTEQKFIEYVGKENKGTLPNLVTKYNKENATLSAEVKNTSEVDVEKIELIYRGEVLETKNSNTVTFSNLQYTGWYMVRVTAKSGQMRYAWIRGSSTVIAPNIEIISDGVAVNDWYGADQVPLKVRISTDNPTAKAIHYTLGGVVSGDKTEEGTSVELEAEFKDAQGRSKSGTITITAYVLDGLDENANQSETATRDINYDNIKPTLAKKITPEKQDGKNWYNSQDVKISLADSTDGNSGVAKYKYRYTAKDEEYDKDVELNTYKEVTDYVKTPITIEKDGIRTIEIVVEDRAGNVSDPQKVEIYKDSTAPTFINDEISITGVTTNSFTINTDAKDNLSGNPKRDPSYKIMYKYTVKPQNGDPLTLQNNVTENNTYTVTGLTPNVMYIITIEATDMAENRATYTDKQQKTKGELLTPDIQFEPSEPTNNGWYHENVKAIITDKAEEARTGSKHIVYEITGQHEQIGEPRKVEAMLEEEGNIDVTAHVVDDEGGSSETNTKNVKIDKTDPNAPTVTAKTNPDGKNNWYKSNVSVEITGISDKEKTGVKEISGVDKVTYSIDSGNEQTITLESTSITEKEIADAITADGEHTIKAWTYDKAGNKSDVSAELKINKDGTAPSKAELTVGAADYHKIPVTAKGDDAISKVASYTFYYSATSADSGWNEGVTIDANSENPNTSAYTYEGLETGKTYWFKVVVTDNAGNTTESEPVKGKTKGDLKAPTINLTSTKNEDKMTANDDTSWRKGNITIEITDSADSAKTSATQVKYQITKKDGTNVKSETVKLPLTLKEEITTDDVEYTITAWAVGKETGDISESSSTRTVKRDVTVPSTAKLTKGTETYNSIPVTATGEDATSGVAKYKFYISSTSKDAGYDNGTEKTASTTSQNTQEHTYSGLLTGTTYWLKVDVTDNAGNTTTSTPIEVKTLGKLQAPTITLTSSVNTDNMADTSDDTWRKGNISISITDSVTAAESSATGIRYEITTNNGDAAVNSTGNIPVKLTDQITKDGTYTIKAWAVGRTGEEAGPTTRTVKKDTVPPEAPSLPASNGINGSKNGEWYNSKSVTVTLQAGADPAPSSDIKQILYGFTSSNITTPLAGKSGVVTIDENKNGDITIYAKTEDNAGNITTASPYSITIKKDCVNPTKATLTKKGDAGTDTITVTAQGADTHSGVASYRFQKSTTSATSGFEDVETVTNTASSIEYTYTGLTDDTTYYLRVVVKDKAGNEKIGDAIEVKTEKAGPDLKVGDYVDYQRWINDWDETNHTGGRTYNADRTGQDENTEEEGGIDYYSGVNDNTSSSKETNTAHTTEELHWRIYSVDKDTKEMLIISDVPTNYTLTLYGENGYNNAVKLLNDLCAECYSSLELGTEARSIKKEDIENIRNEDGTKIYEPTNYKKGSYKNGETYEITSDSRNIPNIYEYEKGAVVNGETGNKLGLSEQDKWYSGYSSKSDVTSLSVKYTHYYFSWSSLTIPNHYRELIVPSSGYYWVASRGVDYNSSYADFYVFRVLSGRVSADHLFSSYYNRSSGNNSVRPVVSISLQTTYVGETGTGARETPYSLRPVDLIGKYINYGDFVEGVGTTYYNADATGTSDSPDYAQDGKYGINHYSSGDGVSASYKNSAAPTTENLNWRIFKIAGNEMTLISENPTTYTLRLYGYEGYNNGVKLLNDLCKKCYSSKELGTEARSIKIEDIEGLKIYEPTSYKTGSYKNGETYPITSSTYRNIPNIYSNEKGAVVNGEAGNKLGLSEQEQWYSGYTETSNVNTLSVKYTYYYYSWSSLTIPSRYKELIVPSSGYYWVASRCVNFRGSNAYFSVFSVYSGGVGAGNLLSSYTYRGYVNYSVRPVVTINLDNIDLKLQEDDGTVLGSSETSPIAIKAKS